MKYNWRISKYSKVVSDDQDKLSYCGRDLDAYSQTITHSQYDTQSVHNEVWLHTYSKTNVTLEVSLCGVLEIRLLIHAPPHVEVITLEHLRVEDKMNLCIKQKVLGCKIGLKKFQITFYNIQEIEIFIEKFNERFGGGISKNLIWKFMRIVEGIKVDEEIKSKMKTNRDYYEIRSELLELINRVD
ncbi:hypothetical protein NBO_1302g0001 [Nosema bombycis CQ1]|uniref:Uncharacterized protein n=1 Tax=Nosema bombycis (strain CQ1 / CVCC 102059) TaxID=578461 RepID=R0LZU9_NOSB1|nr:hypothetical protein NBO_1302g0001 [Nosema bombycis CQ1]|eukprot:EOB11299.1 hypothetical protein NBO_1302g0001 [Nosema bombycis CQ1]